MLEGLETRIKITFSLVINDLLIVWDLLCNIYTMQICPINKTWLCFSLNVSNKILLETMKQLLWLRLNAAVPTTMLQGHVSKWKTVICVVTSTDSKKQLDHYAFEFVWRSGCECIYLHYISKKNPNQNWSHNSSMSKGIGSRITAIANAAIGWPF